MDSDEARKNHLDKEPYSWVDKLGSERFGGSRDTSKNKYFNALISILFVHVTRFKRFEIYIAGLEFELERAPRVRAWDSRGFTRSPGLTKYTFRGWGFLESKKKKVTRFKCYLNLVEVL